MLETGCISNEDYNSALSETINLVTSDTEKQNYAESYAYYCAVRALMQQQGFVFRNEFVGDSDKQQYEDEYDDLYSAVQKTLLPEDTGFTLRLT